jgi:hypothetical protein
VAFAPSDVPNHFWALGILCSILLDADVIGFFFGIPYRHVFGHKGFFHSLLFGLLFGDIIRLGSCERTHFGGRTRGRNLSDEFVSFPRAMEDKFGEAYSRYPT